MKNGKEQQHKAELRQLLNVQYIHVEMKEDKNRKNTTFERKTKNRVYNINSNK